MTKTHIDFLVLWQSLVVPPYRTVWRELNKLPGWRTTMIAPTHFREGGMQDLACAANDPRNPQLIVLPAKRWHTQAVFFKGLGSVLRTWLGLSGNIKVFLCFAEPYAFTALFGWLALLFARFYSPRGRRKPLFLLFAFQNIYKSFPIPIRLTQTLMFRVCDAIFVPGDEHEKVLRLHGYTGPVIRFPMWVDAALFYSEPKASETKIKVGYAGSLLPEKGITQVLDAFIETPEILVECSFGIVGGGQSKYEVVAKIDQMSALGIEASFIGSIPAEKMPEFYRSLDILIVPSLTTPHWKEQFGRVIIEAMACGCLVIGSDSGEIPHVINDSRRIFAEGNMSELRKIFADALMDVRQNRNELRSSLSDNAIQKYADFNVAKVVEANLASITG